MNMIKIEANIAKPIEEVWKCWTDSEHIVNWYFASDDWECPKAENDLKVGGRFTYVMAAKDGSAQFDFGGEYNEIIEFQKIEYKLDDDRKVIIEFLEEGGITKIVESFEPEDSNPHELQRDGWQAILDNFKAYIER